MWSGSDSRSLLFRTIAVCVAVYSFALYARLSLLPGVMVLQDTVGPFWASVRLDGRAHADPYGVAMLLPYWAIVHVADSLWAAMNWLAVLHALVAPVAAWCSLRIFESHWVTAVLVGTIVGLDPGLLDTFQSGAEGYFAALLIGVASIKRGTAAWLAFVCAVANHPLALATFPLVMNRPEGRRFPWAGLVVCAMLLGWQVIGWGNPGVGGGQHDIWTAIAAYGSQGGAFAILLCLGPVVGLFQDKGRSLAIRVVLSLLLLCGAGVGVDYLRDHHLRLLTIPAALCWLSLGRWCWLPLSMALLIPSADDRPPESGLRASTLGLVSQLGRKVVQFDEPMMVDRVWISGDPGVEPSALMLDLWFRGWREIAPGENMVTVVAGTQTERSEYGSIGTTVMTGHGYEVVVATVEQVRKWSEQFCGTGVRLGGAWDALSAINPEVTVEVSELWWECP